MNGFGCCSKEGDRGRWCHWWCIVIGDVQAVVMMVRMTKCGVYGKNFQRITNGCKAEDNLAVCGGSPGWLLVCGLETAAAVVSLVVFYDG